MKNINDLFNLTNNKLFIFGNFINQVILDKESIKYIGIILLHNRWDFLILGFLTILDVTDLYQSSANMISYYNANNFELVQTPIDLYLKKISLYSVFIRRKLNEKIYL